METIILLISEEKNIKPLDELTNDPAFVVSLMKLKGLEKMPDQVKIKIGVRKPKKEDEENANT